MNTSEITQSFSRHVSGETISAITERNAPEPRASC